MAPYMARMIATGRYPMLGRAMTDSTQLAADITFTQGLGYVLDGLAAHLH
ncbi:MAG: hypothetical protein JWQ81_5282 [Amycolatopsis sp.]|jgi:hypothetical protein|nr:TetR/AcrR family transcriptional regulator C-terminal domain-containing protein [Amycolatopsis sp.]MCU1684543.1 hypothetical protein [Amycolatopsis sp.]